MNSLKFYVFVGLFALGIATGQAATYDFATLDPPNSSGTYPLSMNNSGQVVGKFYDSTKPEFPGTFPLFKNGDAYIPLNVPNATRGSDALSINNRGQVYGRYFDNQQVHGYMYSGGVYTSFDPPDSAFVLTAGINDNGQIAGGFQDANNGQHGFLYSGGNYTILDIPGADKTLATGINNTNTVVGYYYISNIAHGFIYSGGVFTTIDPPNSTHTEAYGINNKEQVVGMYAIGKIPHGFIYSGGVYTTIDAPGGFTLATGINDNGQVVGNYFTDPEYTISHGFLASPTLATSLSLNGSSLAISLIASSYLGNNADWWLVAMTPWGHWYSYVYPNQWKDLGTDLNKATPAYQGPLIDLSNLVLFNTTGIPSGNYVIYFGVDTNMNGVLDYDLVHYSRFSMNAP